MEIIINYFVHRKYASINTFNVTFKMVIALFYRRISTNISIYFVEILPNASHNTYIICTWHSY